MDKFTIETYIQSYFTDMHDRLRPSSFMEMAQEMAGLGAAKLGFGDTDLEPINAVWVLARMQVRFDTVPHRNDPVVFSTWHKGMKGPQFLRDYQMLTPDGKPVVSATSSWLIMELDERKLMYGDALQGRVPAEPQHTDHAIQTPCPKVMMPRDTEAVKVGEHTVSYSDVDFNRHTNNTKYILWSCDFLPEDLMYEHQVSEFAINFNKESKPGETITIYRACKDGEWFIEGRNPEGTQCFIAKFTFA